MVLGFLEKYNLNIGVEEGKSEGVFVVPKLYLPVWSTNLYANFWHSYDFKMS